MTFFFFFKAGKAVKRHPFIINRMLGLHHTIQRGVILLNSLIAVSEMHQTGWFMGTFMTPEKKIDSLTLKVWVWAEIELKGTVCVCVCGFSGVSAYMRAGR